MAPVTVYAPPGECSLQFNPVGTASFTRSCDSAKAALARNAVPYSTVSQPPGTVASIHIGEQVISAVDGKGLSRSQFAAQTAAFNAQVTHALASSGYPATAAPADVNRPMLVLLITILIVYLGDIYYGLWYPVVVASCTFVIGLVFLPETRFAAAAKISSARASTN